MKSPFNRVRASVAALQVELAGCLPFAFFLGLALLTFLTNARASQTEPVSDPRTLLEELNSVSVDPSQVYVLRDVEMRRDRARIYFNRGFIGFFQKTGGEITGAAFTGDGEVLLAPPTAVEKQSLAQFTGSPILEEHFTSAYLRFTDATAHELLAKARPPDPESLEQPTGFEEQWDPVVRHLNPVHSLRLLEDLLGDREYPYFHVRINGQSLGIVEMTVDERQPEAVRVAAARMSRGRLFTDTWCSFPSRVSASRSAVLVAGAAVPIAYKIETRIDADNSLQGHAELVLESRSGADRTLGFELSHRLNVSEVKDEQDRTLSVFREPLPVGPTTSAEGEDWLVVVLPSTYPAGRRFRLAFAYQGNVIADVGNGVLYVGAHDSWYPNRNASARATYDLAFHVPDRLTLVATGRRVEESSSEGWKNSRWVSDGLLPVVGFNLGRYDSRFCRMGNVSIEVYATREAEASLEQRYRAAQSPSLVIPPAEDEGVTGVAIVPGRAAPLDPSSLLDKVSDRAAEATQYFEALFGPLPYPRLAISQIPGSFGQGWPELVYLPTLSFLAPEERSELGLRSKSAAFQDRLFVAHEIAHQWWGNLVGWKTYHDQWLSEGFASYAAALALAREKGGEVKFRELLRGYKRDLTGKTKDGSTIESGGPIWLGQRLSNSLNPEGYDAIVYKKACWVLHMLRSLTKDPVTGSDEKFFKMLRDFVTTYKGQNPSTEDFVRHAERYMTRASDIEGNRRLAWFFDEWVYGTEIPTYQLRSSVRRLGPKKFVVQGTIDQSEVASSFEMLVPIVVESGAGRVKGKKLALGPVVVNEAGGRFQFTTGTEPVRVAIDEDSILALVR